MRKFLFSLVATVIVSSTNTFADVLVYEGFNYYGKPGANKGNWGTYKGAPLREVNQDHVNGGIGWKGSWSESNNPSSKSAMYIHKHSFERAGVKTSGGFYQTSNTRFRTMDTSSGSLLAKKGYLNSNGKIGKVGTSVYVSFFASFQNVDGWRGISLYSGSSEKMYIGKNNHNKSFWKIEESGGKRFDNPNIKYSTDQHKPQFIVMKLTFNAGSTKVEFWVNPDTTKSKLIATANITGTTKNALEFDTIRIDGEKRKNGRGTNSGDTILDEFRIATSYSSALGVPEPTTLLLLASGGAGLLARRKRNKSA